MRKKKLSKQELRKNIINVIIPLLKKLFPKVEIMLQYSNNFELLVAVILSAQCTDKMVNKVTEKLFKKYKKLDDYVNADPKEFEKDIHSTGFFRNKTKNILAAAKIFQKEFKRKIPKTMEEMITIPGVGRKTANVVLGTAHGVYEGIAVDTHVKRLSKKFGLTNKNDPNKIEQDLMKIVPKKDWFHFTYLLIEYGRNYSPARKVKDESDPVSKAIISPSLQKDFLNSTSKK